MEEALGADGHGFLEQHDALIGLVAEELQGGEAARRRHVEMLPAARGHDKAVCLGFAIWVHRFPRFMLPSGAVTQLSTHAAHSQLVTVLVLAVRASLIPHPLRVCGP